MDEHSVIMNISEMTSKQFDVIQRIANSYEVLNDRIVNEIVTMIFTTSEEDLNAWLQRHPIHPKRTLQIEQFTRMEVKNNSKLNDNIKIENNNDIEIDDNMIMDENFIDFDDEPKFDCDICTDEFKVSNMYTVSCNSSHRYCFECIKHYVDGKLQELKFITCPALKCEYQFTPLDLRHIGMPPSKVSDYDAWLTSKVLEKNAVACPGRDCKGFIYPSDPTIKEPYHCERCDFISCTKCKRMYHYRSECTEVGQLETRWLSWCQSGRDRYWSQKQKEAGDLQRYEENKRKHEQNVLELNKRYAEFNQDEEYKRAHCRVCPNCGRAIQKLEGCDSMKCGTDYHGGNAQNGCGHTFSWSSARPYTPEARQLRNSTYDVAQPKVVQQFRHQINCGYCGNEVIGILFSCLNCCCFEICENCEMRGIAIDHGSNHIFVIHTS